MAFAGRTGRKNDGGEEQKRKNIENDVSGGEAPHKALRSAGGQEGSRLSPGRLGRKPGGRRDVLKNLPLRICSVYGVYI